MEKTKRTKRGRRDSIGTRQAKKNEPLIEKPKGWPGYVRNGVWIIEKKINGKKYHVSTRCTQPRAAWKQLDRFQENPLGYNPAGEGPADALVLDLEMIDELYEWHRRTVATPEWPKDVRRMLKHWANHLRGADLRNLSLIDDLKPFVAGDVTGKPLRVASIKVLFGWLLREKGLITRAQNVTEEFTTPPIPPRQDTGESKAVEFERLAAVVSGKKVVNGVEVPLLAPHVRDVLELLAVTGWHISEMRRFAKPEIGRFRYRDAADKPEVLATIGTRHKVGGRWHFTALLAQPHVDAALRIRERGYVIDRTNLRKALHRACVKAGVKEFNMGDMRASVLTWLRIAGVDPAVAMAYVGHTSIETQNRYYVKAEVARAVLPATALRVIEGGKKAG